MKIRFISIDQEQISVKLDSIGELLESGFTYKTDSVAQTNYTIGSLIAADQYIEFEFDNVSKDSSNYYQFATSGADIKLSGTLESNQNYAFYNLFKNCKNIVDASQLSVGEGVGKYSHANLFESCTKLTTPPTSLASGQLKDWCYSGIFNRCSSLTGVPALPSNDLALCCYNSMFYNCKSLQTAPILSATTLAPFCYNSMFNCCNSLTGITLPASTLVNGCYKNMFMDCKSLSSITVAFTEWNESATQNWVKNVAPKGIFYKPQELDEQYGVSQIPPSWKKPNQNNPLTFKALQNGTTVCLTKTNEPNQTDILYSKNGEIWKSYSFGTNISLQADDIVHFMNTTSGFSTSQLDNYHFNIHGPVKIYGNIQSLVNYAEELSSNYQYVYLFSSNSNTIDASELILPNNTTRSCYAYMFKGCSGLIAAPYLPASSLTQYCYDQMFYNCKSLSSLSVEFTSWWANNYYSPDYTRGWVYNVADAGVFTKPYSLYDAIGNDYIPTYWTYKSFQDRDAVNEPITFEVGGGSVKIDFVTTNEQLNPTIYYKIDDGEWNESIVGPPRGNGGIYLSSGQRLSYKGLSGNQYQKRRANNVPRYQYYCHFQIQPYQSYSSANVRVYGNINSLYDSYDREAHNHFYGMFSGIPSGIKLDAFNLVMPSSLQNNSFVSGYLECAQMFKGCSGLVATPPLDAKDVGPYSYWGMFANCVNLSSVPFELPATGLASACYMDMFSGCTSLKGLPTTLPANNLAPSCYYGMFKNCDKLTETPFFPATGLAKSCYKQMFLNCYNLAIIHELPATTLAESCYEGMFAGCSAIRFAQSILPAKKLAEYCYKEMFANCNHLHIAPRIAATQFARYCCQYMFNYCSILAQIDVDFTHWPNNNIITEQGALQDWLSHGQDYGEHYGCCILPYFLQANSQFVPSNWYKAYKTVEYKIT